MYHINSEPLYTTYYFKFLETQDGIQMQAMLKSMFTQFGFTEDEYSKFIGMFNARYWNYEIYCDYNTVTKQTDYGQFTSSIVAITRRYIEYYHDLLMKYKEPLDESEGIKSVTTDIDLPNSRVNAEYPSNKTISTGNENVVTLRRQALNYIRNIFQEFVEKYIYCFILIFD